MSASDSADEARPVSPDSQCRICLGPLQTKCIADSNCFHKFCLSCLKRWSEVKAECPLCKRPFKKIIYNMKVSGEYDFHDVQPPPPRPEFLPIQEAIRRYSDVLVLSFSTDSTRERQNVPGGRVGMYFQYSDLPSSRYVLTSGPPTQDRETVSYRRSLAFRQSVYGQRLWVHDISQTRECNPTYYRENPEQLSRLRPWLKRELAVFVPYGRQLVETTENVLELMTHHNINSREFRNAVAPIIGERFNHFLHELRCFAQSYYDMRGFDANGVYDIPRPVRGSGRAARMFPAPPTYESDDDVVEVTSAAAQNEIVLSDSDSDIELIEQPLPEIVISSGDESRPPRRPSASVSNEVAEISPTASDQTNDFDPDFQPTPSTSSGSTSHPETRKHLSKRSKQNKRSSKSATRRRRRDSSSSSDSAISHHWKKKLIQRRDERKKIQAALATCAARRRASSSNLVAGSSRPVDRISKRTRSETSRRKREKQNSMSDSDSDETSRARGSRLNPRYVISSESSAGSDEERPKVKHVPIR